MRPRLRLGGLLSLLLLGAGLMMAARKLDKYTDSPYPLVQNLPFRSEIAALPAFAPTTGVLSDKRPLPVAFSVRSGQTLGHVLDELGLEAEDAHQLTTAIAEHVDLRRLRPQDRYTVTLDPDDNLEVFEIAIEAKGKARAVRSGGGWDSSWHDYERSVTVASAGGALSDSLETAILQAGGESALIYRMADVLQWDLDFNRDLRQGDRFSIVYEKVYLDGRYHSVGSILALHYENLGKRLEAYRFGDPAGYYDSEGRPLRKMFLRSPLPYSRVTSRFSNRRFHPVLKTYRPHYGVDYGAPRGTAVRSTANGVVTFAGWDRGGGNTVKIRHANSYLTAYLHLSRFASGIRSGRRVEQGQVVGYVGSTGLSTAPHLDYRVQHRGRWLDPLSLRSIPADPIPVKQLPEFLAWRDRARASLDSGQPIDPDEAAPFLRAALGASESPSAISSSR